MLRVLALMSLCSAGCLTFSDFQFERPLPEQTVGGSPVQIALDGAFPISLSLDLSTYLQALPSTRPVQMSLEDLQFSVTGTERPPGDTDDFGFVRELHVFVSSSKVGSTLPRLEIAYVNNTSLTPTLHMGIDVAYEWWIDLAPYVREGATVDATGSGYVPPDPVSFDGSAVFTIHPM